MADQLKSARGKFNYTNDVYSNMAQDYQNMYDQSGWMTSQDLSPLEQQQMAQIGAGRANAEQTIQQNTREQATGRGLFSSAGAIGQEAAGLAQLDLNEAQQKYDLFGNAQNRVFQGYGMRAGMLGGKSQAAQGYMTSVGNQAGITQTLQGQEAASQQSGMNNAMNAASLLYMHSDSALKTDIKPIENALDKVKQLNGVNWKWKANGKSDDGIIAQDVEKVFPELVIEKDGYKAVNYNGLIGVLIEAVKELGEK